MTHIVLWEQNNLIVYMVGNVNWKIFNEKLWFLSETQMYSGYGWMKKFKPQDGKINITVAGNN